MVNILLSGVVRNGVGGRGGEYYLQVHQDQDTCNVELLGGQGVVVVTIKDCYPPRKISGSPLLSVQG